MTSVPSETFPAVVLFDGVCKLCNGTVNLLLKLDRKKKLKYASLQSNFGQKILAENNLNTNKFHSIYFLEKGKLKSQSSAILHIVKYLRFPWPLLSVALIIPRFFRDVFYSLVARNRYKWFGKYDTCQMPSPETLDRFLE